MKKERKITESSSLCKKNLTSGPWSKVFISEVICRSVKRQKIYDDTVANLILKLIWKSKCTRRAKRHFKKE